MRIRKAGKITDNLWLLGTEESCVYLLEGSSSAAIISAGMNYIIPDVLRQITAFGIAQNKIAHMIILHAHFDHVGIVPYFKRNYPQLNICASQRGWEVLAKPKTIEVINQYSMLVTKKVAGALGKISAIDWEWRDDVRGSALKDGDKIDLGGMTIDIYETPGHSSCSITAYAPQLQALFPSDAAAIPFKNEIIPVPNSSFILYRQSLEKLNKLPVSIIGCDHYGYITGAEAAGYIDATIAATVAMRRKFARALNKSGSIDRAAALLVIEHFKDNPDYFIAPEILTGVYSQMLKSIISEESKPN
ncbi:MAG TPA: MBL fold metallo-hydrolase [Smithellaceae bacterium]|nr:MBL fold metallo-hydrolase [Smithellaceae bacterium]